MKERVCMKVSPLFALFAALLVCVSAGAQSSTWKTYSYPADGFSISAPSEPQLSSQNVPTDAGTFVVHLYASNAGTVALYVGRNDYGSAMNGRDPHTVLTAAMNGAATAQNGHLTKSQNIQIGKYPGYSFEGVNDQGHFYARNYLVGSVLYQLIVMVPTNQTYGDAEQFLGSFRLTAQ